MPRTNEIPTYDQLMIPLLSALRKLGGSASIDEMYEEVVEEQGFSEEALAVLQNPEKTNQTKDNHQE